MQEGYGEEYKATLGEVMRVNEMLMELMKLA